MADEISTPRIKTRNLAAQNVNMQNVHVTRFDTSTGAEKSGETDILMEIKEVLLEQTETIKTSMKGVEDCCENFRKLIEKTKGTGGAGATAMPTGMGSILDELIKALKDLPETIRTTMGSVMVERGGLHGGGEGGSGHDKAGGRFSDITELESIHKIYEEFVKNGAKDFKTFLSQSMSVFQIQYKANIGMLRGVMFDFVKNMAEFGSTISRVKKNFDTYMTASAANTGTFWDMMFDDFAFGGLARGGDSLTETFKLIRTAAESDMIKPIGLFGRDLEEVSVGMRDFRSEIEDLGFNWASRMNFSEMNESVLQLFELQRRQNMDNQVRDSDVQRNITSQLEVLDIIAANTGKTVAELIKANQQDNRELSDLVAAGIISPEQSTGYGNVINYLRSMGLTAVADALMNVARSGGSVELALSQNQDLQNALTAQGNVGAFGNLAAFASGSGNMSPTAMMQGLQQLAGQFNTSNLGAAGSQVIGRSGQELYGQLNMMPDTIAAGIGDENSVAGFFNDVLDFFTNVLPSQNIALIGALGANTFAIWANTRAHGFSLFGGLGRVLGGFGRGIAGTVRGLVSGLGAILGFGGMGLGAGGAAAAGSMIPPILPMGGRAAGAGAGAAAGGAARAGGRGILGGIGGLLGRGAGMLGRIAGGILGGPLGWGLLAASFLPDIFDMFGGGEATAAEPSDTPMVSLPGGTEVMMSLDGHMRRQADMMFEIREILATANVIHMDILNALGNVGGGGSTGFSRPAAAYTPTN